MSDFVLRDYQHTAVRRGVEHLKTGGDGAGLIVLPTGSGKSLVIANIVQSLEPTLIFQPTREVLEQNANKLISYGYSPAVYSASMKSREVGDITLATIGSVKGQPDLFDRFRHVIVDEAHLVNPEQGMYKDFLAALGGKVRVLGLTATPFRLSTDGFGGSMLKFLTRTRPRVFTDVLSYAQVGDLIAKGYLVKPEYQIVSGFVRKEVALNSTGADFDTISLKRHFNRTGFDDRLKRVILRLLAIGRKNVLVFTQFVEQAEALTRVVPGTALLTAKTPEKQRRAIVDGFRSGEVPVVANVNVLGIGFDYPQLETVVLARPTVSLGLYYQQVGRLLRPHPEKKSAWVVDMVDQVAQFGKIEDLWLQPGGKTGAQWEMVTRGNGHDRALTNVYFADEQTRKRLEEKRRQGRFRKLGW